MKIDRKCLVSFIPFSYAAHTHLWRSLKKKPPAIASHSIEVIIKSRIDSSLNELLQIMREFFYGSTFCMLTNARKPFFIAFDIIFILPRANQTLLSCALAEDFNCLLWKISAVILRSRSNCLPRFLFFSEHLSTYVHVTHKFP